MDLERITPRPRLTFPDRYRIVMSEGEISECHDPKRAAELGIIAGTLCVQNRVKPIDSVTSPLYDAYVNVGSAHDFLQAMIAVRKIAEITRATSPEIAQEALLAVTSMASTKQGANV